MLWGCFSEAGTEGLIRIEEKLNAPNYRDSLSTDNSEPQTGQEVHLPTGQ